MLLEVLPLQHGSGKTSVDGGHERLDEVVVGRAAQPGLAVAEVERVVEQLLVVGADVEARPAASGGVDAGAGGVEGELADGDAHAARALVAQAQDRARCRWPR